MQVRFLPRAHYNSLKNEMGSIEKRFENVSNSKTFHNLVSIYNLGKKAVLDLGCSYGEFLAHFGKGSLGISIDREEVAFGQKKGLNIKLGNIELSEFNLDEKFDAVFANNILEHLYSPHLFLIKIKKFLKPEGILILGVPCIPKITLLLKLKKFRGSMASSHLNFFTYDSLINTVKRSGYKIIAARGFHFKNRSMDLLMKPICPHFYVICRPDKEFSYSEKKLKELEGYKNKQ